MPLKLERLLLLLLVVFFVPPIHCGAQKAQQDSVSLAVASDNVYPDASSFVAELERIGNAIEEEKANPAGLAALGKSLPSQWEINTGERHYSLSAAPLGELLFDAGREKNAQGIAAKAAEGAAWTFDLANQVKAYAGARTGNGLSARPSLERILSRREFGSARGPSAWDLFRQRANRWIEVLLLRLFRQIGRYPMGAKVLFWFVITAAVLWLAVFLFRYWMRRTALEELQVPETVVFVRTWQEWIQAAREAATRGDFREAVHSAYWAGISYLEDSEVVRKDRTRTPREYMRLVANSTQLVASGRKTREALSALTVALEQVWYGGGPVSKQDFANAMQSVEALGCQLQ
jgi:Domain of unknown function (DUF4129)